MIAKLPVRSRAAQRMIVIVDTGPINYLILIEEIAVLPALYGRVVIPRSVCDELGRTHASQAVRAWIAQPDLPTGI